MAISSSKKPLPLPLLAFITIHLMLLIYRVNSSEEVSFRFDKFHDDKNLILQGDASFSSSNALQLTKVDDNGVPLPHRVGRALYSAPIHLWDSSSGEAASISTTFTFLVKAPYTNPPADGLAFFLASPDTTIPSGSTGGLLGLFSGGADALKNSSNKIVGFNDVSSDNVFAVEFDTFTNHIYGDPDYKHIGIDVNSIHSTVTREWTYWENGGIENVTITYDPVGKKLRVVASYPSGDSIDFTYEIDLTTVLPEWVRVGFSGSTGAYTQVNNILSWCFHSTLVEEGDIASVV